MSLKSLTTTWTGIRPLLMHNGQTADPLNPFAKAIAAINADKALKKTEAGIAKLRRIEFEAGLYWDEKAGPVIPSDNLERVIQLGAQKSKRGKDVQAALFCVEPQAVLHYDGPRDIQKLHDNARFKLIGPVVIGQSRVIRCRPMFPTGWTLTFTVEFDDSILNPQTVKKSMEDAGALVGLGDWRPKFGRFSVETK